MMLMLMLTWCFCCSFQTVDQKVAIIWEGDEPTDIRHVTYRELHREVCKLANLFKVHPLSSFVSSF